jgi:hypothetical protein
MVESFFELHTAVVAADNWRGFFVGYLIVSAGFSFGFE